MMSVEVVSHKKKRVFIFEQSIKMDFDLNDSTVMNMNESSYSLCSLGRDLEHF